MYKLKLLIDTNVLLDWILSRNSQCVDTVKIIGLCMQGDKIYGYLTANTLLEVYSVVSVDKRFNVTKTQELMKLLYDRFEILQLDRKLILKSIISLPHINLEKALHAYAADYEKIDFMVTRDVDDFNEYMGLISKANKSNVKVLNPKTFLGMIERIGRRIDINDDWGLVYGNTDASISN